MEHWYDPWGDLERRYPSIIVDVCDLKPARAAWVPSYNVILLDGGSSLVEQRCVLSHEIAHIDLGHEAGLCGVLGRRQERHAWALAALRLVTVPALRASPHWPDGRNVAAGLGVTLPVLRARVRLLTDGEMDVVAERVVLLGSPV